MEHTLTPGELYERLKAHCPGDKEGYFPANAKSLTNHLRRIAPAQRMGATKKPLPAGSAVLYNSNP
jgi:hypothetical protein